MWQVVRTRTAWRRPVYWYRVPVVPVPRGTRPAIAPPQFQGSRRSLENRAANFKVPARVHVITSAGPSRAIERRPS
jgi:hypothetical protein